MAAEDFFKSWSSTQIKLVKHQHTWTVNDFSLYDDETGKPLLSPPFTAGINSENKLKWRLELYPKRDDREHSSYVSVFLTLLTPHSNGIQAKYKICIVNVKGEHVNIRKDSSRFVFKENGWGFSKFVKQELLFNKKSEILVDDKLILVCEIIAAIGSGHISGTLAQVQNHGVDFGFLFENQELSDVTLSAGGREFPAHRVVLAGRSSVFRVMFQNGTKEIQNNRIEITGIDEEGLRETLRFMYTGKVNHLEKMAPTLLIMAEKYAMGDLKMFCENALFQSLSLQNAAQIFILSHQFGITKLKNQVKEFIGAHSAVLVNSPEFQSMVRTYPHLAVEVFLPLDGDSSNNGTA